MKGKEEDEERNENICPQTDKQTINQSLNSKTEAHSNRTLVQYLYSTDETVG